MRIHKRAEENKNIAKAKQGFLQAIIPADGTKN